MAVTDKMEGLNVILSKPTSPSQSSFYTNPRQSSQKKSQAGNKKKTKIQTSHHPLLQVPSRRISLEAKKEKKEAAARERQKVLEILSKKGLEFDFGFQYPDREFRDKFIEESAEYR